MIEIEEGGREIERSTKSGMLRAFDPEEVAEESALVSRNEKLIRKDLAFRNVLSEA
jgi:hypothetical protein